MRSLLALAALSLSLAACTSKDDAPVVVVDVAPEIIAADSVDVLDEAQAAPVETSTPPPTVADAPPAATPVVPAPRVESTPPAAPAATHTMDDGMTMDGHTMDEGMPMDHSQTDHAHDDGQ